MLEASCYLVCSVCDSILLSVTLSQNCSDVDKKLTPNIAQHAVNMWLVGTARCICTHWKLTSWSFWIVEECLFLFLIAGNLLSSVQINWSHIVSLWYLAFIQTKYAVWNACMIYVMLVKVILNTRTPTICTTECHPVQNNVLKLSTNSNKINFCTVTSQHAVIIIKISNAILYISE